ncbi:MAG: lasso peptide biosynthesis PqqD family chaperone [Bacillota bacterium]
MTNDCVYSQVEGNIVSDMDGEKVMFSIANGKYYNLGDVGGVIWDLLQEPKSIKSMVLQLVEAYDVDEQTCEAQVMEFITMLHKEGLITQN